AFEYGSREFVAEIEHDLASRRRERLEMPAAVEPTKRPVAQLDDDELGPHVTIGGRKVCPHAVIVDIDPHQRRGRSSLENGGAVAPRQKLGVILNPLDQVEHLLRAVLDEHRFADAGHCYNSAEVGKGGNEWARGRLSWQLSWHLSSHLSLQLSRQQSGRTMSIV